MKQERRTTITFDQMVEELAILFEMSKPNMSRILRAYAASGMRALSEDFIFECLPGVRLQVEDYFDPRNNRHRKRIAVNPEYKTQQTNRPIDQIQEEYDRATGKLGLSDNE